MSALTNEHNYTFPTTNLLSSGNNVAWRSVKPTSGLTLLSDQNAQLTYSINSSNAALISTQLYIKAKMTLVDDSNAAVGANVFNHSRLGVASLFQNDTVSFSDVEIYRTLDYPALLSYWYNRDTVGSKKWKKLLEGYSTQDRFQKDGSCYMIHHPFNTIFATPQHVPLPVIVGGVTQTFNVGNISDVFPNFATAANPASGKRPTRILLSDISINYPELVLDQAYVQQLVHDMRSGGKLYISFVDCEQYISQAVAAREQQIIVNTKRPQSIQGFFVQMRKPADIADKTKDRNYINSHCDLTSFSVQAAGLTIQPKERRWALDLTDNGSGTVKDPEAWYLQYLTANGGYGSEYDEVVDDPNAGQFTFGLNFSASSDGSNVYNDGLDMRLSDGQFIINTTHATDVPQNTKIITTMFVDKVICIETNFISVLSVW